MLKLDIKKSFNDFNLDVNLQLGKELVAVMGPSGSGKSLTLRCLVGLLEPDAGEIVLNERTLFSKEQGINIPPQERKIGYVFQNYALFPHLTVEQNIVFGLTGITKREKRERLHKYLTQMRLEGLEKRRPAQLSGGQQQRVALARALIIEPDLLLLDEPFSALDGPVRGRLEQELLQLLDNVSVPTLVVTHNIDEAYRLSKKMAIFNDGRILQYGEKEDVLYQPASRTVARFTGTKNIFDGRVTKNHEDTVEVVTPRMTIQLRPQGRNFNVGDEVSFCIRPKEVFFVDLNKKNRPAGPNEIKGYISQIMTNIDSYTVFVKLHTEPVDGKDYDLQVEVSPRRIFKKQNLKVGGPYTVVLNLDSISLLTN